MPTSSHSKIGGLSVETFEPQSLGSSATLLFVHGAWVGGWIWEEFPAYLADRGHVCHVMDLRGRYDSSPVDDLGRVSVLDFVQDVLTVAAEVRPEFLVGESMGGLISIKAAESLRQLKGLIVMNPAPPFMVPVHPKLLLRQLKYLPDLLFNRPNHPAAEDYKALLLNNVPEPEASKVYARITPESGRALAEMSLGRIKADPSKINASSYVVIGHLDALVPAKAHHRTAAILRAKVADYPTMSHHSFSETGWEKVAEDIIEWMSSVG